MIEPKGPATPPLQDGLTALATAVLKAAEKSPDVYKGVHHCVCGAASDNRDYFVGGVKTNSLLVHYVACRLRRGGGAPAPRGPQQEENLMTEPEHALAPDDGPWAQSAHQARVEEF